LPLASAANDAKSTTCVFDNPIPQCSVRFQMLDRWPDGYRIKFQIPITAAANAWTLMLVFARPIKKMDFPDGEITSITNNTEFTIKNKIYNRKLRKGSNFASEMTVHYKRQKELIKIVAAIFDPAQFICANSKYATILANRYKDTKVVDAYNANATNGCSMEYIDNFPDGFRAVVKFPPTTRDRTSWTATMQFDKNLTTLDVPGADIVGGEKSGKGFLLKNLIHNARMDKNTSLALEYTVHFPRKMHPRPRLEQATFDSHVCTWVIPAEPELIGANWLGGCTKPEEASTEPDCSGFWKRDTLWPDGEKGTMKVPVKTNMNEWTLTIKYDQTITTFDSFQADRVKVENGDTFVYKNKSYTGRLKGGRVFDFFVTIHYPRGLAVRPKISLIKLNDKIICKKP